ncbi:MAG: TraB/GumN family protein, partial [Chthoniobacterales bacterium]
TRAAWRRGDVEALATSNARLRAANPAIARKLLEGRNRRWVTRIEAELHRGQPVAIVAGTGHFIGAQGVIALLRARGHTVEQLQGVSLTNAESPPGP